MLRAEVGQTASTAIATQGDTTMNFLLANKQKLFCGITDWPFLEHRWNVAFVGGQRYADFPTNDYLGTAATISTERPMETTVFFGNLWKPVDYGIGPMEFSVRNSDQGLGMDPIMRWAFNTNINETSNANRFEVWPIPQTSQTFRFEGQRQPYPLVTDGNTADLDDVLLVLAAAVDLLSRMGGEAEAEKQEKQALLTQRFNFLTGSQSNRTEKIILGENLLQRNKHRRIVPMIVVHS
jgi:hypothetical protein